MAARRALEQAVRPLRIARQRQQSIIVAIDDGKRAGHFPSSSLGRGEAAT